MLLSLAKQCDVFLHGNVSLKGLWPLSIFSKPYFVTHQGWYVRPSGKVGARDRLKYAAAKRATNIACSKWVADHIPAPTTVIPNPYDDKLFRIIDGERDRELVFLGRLVSDKGVDVLLRALYELKCKKIKPRLTIIGDGPERLQAERLAYTFELDVRFTGTLQGEELVKELNRHQIMVVPSSWEEPFGIVALEGIASGCVVVGSERGGLKEAIGPCGATFPNRDFAALSNILRELLASPGRLELLRSSATNHLERHTAKNVARAYLDLIASACPSPLKPLN
jgi:glycogen(starch) synthase